MCVGVADLGEGWGRGCGRGAYMEGPPLHEEGQGVGLGGLGIVGQEGAGREVGAVAKEVVRQEQRVPGNVAEEGRGGPELPLQLLGDLLTQAVSARRGASV
jgi:hypothetical protein